MILFIDSVSDKWVYYEERKKLLFHITQNETKNLFKNFSFFARFVQIPVSPKSVLSIQLDCYTTYICIAVLQDKVSKATLRQLFQFMITRVIIWSPF